MSEAVNRVLTALRESGRDPRRSRRGWKSRCPAHDDRDPSLSIDRGEDGKALLRCYAGCSSEAIAAALGLRMADLFPDESGRRNASASASTDVNVYRNAERPDENANSVDVDNVDGAKTLYLSPAEAVHSLARRLGLPQASWSYQNAAGEEVGRIVRWDTQPKKTIRPIARAAGGGMWRVGGMPTPRPLYGLPALLKASAGATVYVTEGEKAADACARLGWVSTTSPHGCGAASKADWSALAGRNVIVLPDNDDAGERYATDVAGLTTAAGASSVRVIRLVDHWIDLPRGGDLADLVDRAGENAEALMELRQTIEALAAATPEWVCPPNPSPSGDEFQPFPVGLLPEPVARFIQNSAASIGCDPSYVALPLLSVLAAAIGSSCRILLKPGWSEPAIIWTAIIGESGTHKSPAFRAALAPMRRIQSRAFTAHDTAMEQYKQATVHYEAELAAWRRRVGEDPESTPPEEPRVPTAWRIMVADTTVEALAPILVTNPRGVLLARDELSGWLGSFDRYAKGGRSSADLSHWLSMYDGDAVIVDRKTGAQALHIPSASVCITGGIQPGILAGALSREHRESGLLARLQFAMPPRRDRVWTDNAADPAMDAEIERLLERLLTLSPGTADTGESQPLLLPLSDDGLREWKNFYNAHAKEHSALEGDEAAAWSKLEASAARLSLVVRLVRWAAAESGFFPESIDAECVLAGVNLARWFGQEMRRVYSRLSESDGDRDRRRLLELIERRGGEISARELVQSSRGFRRVEQAEAALDDLVRRGFGRWTYPESTGRGAPKSRRFVRNRFDSSAATQNNRAG